MPYNPLPLLLLPVGIYVLYKIKCFYILHPVRSFGRAFSALRNRENLSAFTLALAGTLGVGNVLGVALGIIVGGAGSLFWLFLSAPISAALKYAEVLISSDGKEGGMYYSIRRSFGRTGRMFAAVYALACLLLSFVMGAALQSRSMVDSVCHLVDVSPIFVAAAVALVVALSVCHGGNQIGRITLFVIPMTTIIYIIVTFSTIIAGAERLWDVIKLVISDAFSPAAGAGGALAFISSRAMREGFARGMLSNEAGAGTSTLGHATGSGLPPAVRGLHGVLEVFFDTSLLCTLTGLAVLVSVPDTGAYSSGMTLILDAVGTMTGALPALFVVISVLAFAYSTLVCWYYYGSECVRQLCGKPHVRLFLPAFLLFILSGAVISEWVLLFAADALLLVLTAITLPTVIKNSDRIALLSESCGFIKLKEADPREGLDSES